MLILGGGRQSLIPDIPIPVKVVRSGSYSTFQFGVRMLILGGCSSALIGEDMLILGRCRSALIGKDVEDGLPRTECK